MTETWEEVLEELRTLMEEGGASMSAHARELGLSPAALSRILRGQTETPHPNTQARIREYLRRRATLQRNVVAQNVVKETRTSPEADLLDYFLEHNHQMATFLSTTTEGLSPEDRRKVAVAIFNGYKKLAIMTGERLPDWFFDLERRFVAE